MRNKKFSPIVINTLSLLLIIFGIINLFSNRLLPDISAKANDFYTLWNNTYYLGYIFFSLQIICGICFMIKRFLRLSLVISVIMSLFLLYFHLQYDINGMSTIKNILPALILFFGSVYLIFVLKKEFFKNIFRYKEAE